MNILNRPWNESFGLPRFDTIQEENFLPALKEAIYFARQNLKNISSEPDRPSFKNTIETFEKFDEMLSRLTALFFNLVNANSNYKLEEIQLDFVKRVSKFYTEVFMNKDLFNRIEILHNLNVAKKITLNDEQKRVLDLYRKDFLRSGVRLSKKDQLKLMKIMTRLAELGANFSQNILIEERSWGLELSETDLAGLSPDLISILKQSGIKRGASFPTVTLSRSHLVPFLENSSRRDLRKKVFLAWVSRGATDNQTNNFALIKEILCLRKERANILGYKNFSAFKLQDQMAANSKNVKNFLKSIWKHAHEKALAELQELKSVINDEQVLGSVKPWDWRYYQVKAKKKCFDYDPEHLKFFFELDSIINAAFFVANKLFNLEFRSVSFSAYHPDVKTWEVKRQGRHIGIFLGDYFARQGKRSGAWCSTLRSQSRIKKTTNPVVINVCNFAKPAKNSSALLSFDDAKTLFHEFGHALHNLLSNVTYNRISGTSVPRDFVELPSQLFEHWLLTPEVLKKFAINKKTGESMPNHLIQAVMDSSNFDSGFATVEYLASAVLDIEIHSREPNFEPETIQAKILAELDMPEGIAMRHGISNFTHIFSGDGYSSGYYSYLWSEMMDADAFEYFREKNNFFDKELAKKLEQFIYSSGGSLEPTELYELFRGRTPSIEPLLRGRGFN